MNHPIWGPILTMGAAIGFGACVGLGISMVIKASTLPKRIAAGVLVAGFVISGVAFHSEHYVCGPVAAERDCHWEFK